MKVGSAVMEWVAVLCLLSGEWWPGGGGGLCEADWSVDE